MAPQITPLDLGWLVPTLGCGFSVLASREISIAVKISYCSFNEISWIQRISVQLRVASAPLPALSYAYVYQLVGYEIFQNPAAILGYSRKLEVGGNNWKYASWGLARFINISSAISTTMGR